MQTSNYHFYRSPQQPLDAVYKKSINNADTAYLLITTSTVWALYVDFCAFFKI